MVHRNLIFVAVLALAASGFAQENSATARGLARLGLRPGDRRGHHLSSVGLPSQQSTHSENTQADAVAKGLAKSRAYRFSTVDFPGAAGSIAYDSNGVTTVGYSILNLFTYRNGNYQNLEIPGVTSAQVFGVNLSGQIVGFYSGSGSDHGFLLTGNLLTTIDPPGAFSSSASDINDAGMIVGDYVDSEDGIDHGYLYSAGTFTTLDFPVSIFTSTFGLNSNGDVVGEWEDVAGVLHGFLYQAGTFTSIDFPVAIASIATGINDSGDIVGNFADTTGHAHGFLYSRGQFTQIDVPGASSTVPFRVKNNGRLVGYFYDEISEAHGMVGY